MIYTELTMQAMRIAFRAHDGQFDEDDIPYIHHPLHVAESMENETAACVALLHDVVEDTDVTFDDLTEMGMPDDVIEALRLLTHDDDTPYFDYVTGIKDSGNATAIAVKLSDLAHNSDPARNHPDNPKMPWRMEKYGKAKAILTRA